MLRAETPAIRLPAWLQASADGDVLVGESPKEEIRHHLQFYPACNGKCKPILHWMLPKTVFETQQTETTIYNKVETLYEDRELAVIYKPEGLLSVPGKMQPSLPSTL